VKEKSLFRHAAARQGIGRRDQKDGFRLRENKRRSGRWGDASEQGQNIELLIEVQNTMPRYERGNGKEADKEKPQATRLVCLSH
jgi:hypothetical protein